MRGKPNVSQRLMSLLWLWRVLGATMVIVGSAALCGLVWIGNSQNQIAQRLMFGLGLAATGLISASAQVMILIGAWLMWRLSRPR